MLIIEDPTVTVTCRTAIKVLFLYFILCLTVMLDSLFDIHVYPFSLIVHVKIYIQKFPKNTSICLTGTKLK